MQKRLLFVAFLLLAICNKIVADDQLTVSDVSMYPGDSKEVSIELTNAESYVGFQFDLYLPNGITIESYSRSSRIPDGTTLEMAQQTDGGYRFIAAGLGGNTITGNEGAVMTITLKSADAIALNDYTAYLRQVKVSKADGSGITVAELPFTVTIAERPKVAPVTFAPNGYRVTLNTTTEGADIYYTLSNSNEGEQTCTSGTELTLGGDCTIMAYAMKNGYNTSDTTTYTFFAADVTVATPTFNQTDNMVTIATTTENTTIYYTLDGTEPTTLSNVYAEPGITLTGNVIVKAFATRTNWFSSAVATYDVTSFKVAPVAFAQNGNQITLNTTTEGATIYYILSTDSVYSEYTAPLTMTGDCTITAYATKVGYTQSETTSFEFHAGGVTCSNPVLARIEGTNVVTATTTTEGATIYCTTDGSEPTQASSVFPEGGMPVYRNQTIKAIAMRDTYYPSQVTTFEVDWLQCETPTFTWNGDELTITSTSRAEDGRGATIFYTMVESSAAATVVPDTIIYNGPITVTRDVIITAIARVDGYKDSQEARLVYPYTAWKSLADAIANAQNVATQAATNSRVTTDMRNNLQTLTTQAETLYAERTADVDAISSMTTQLTNTVADIEALLEIKDAYAVLDDGDQYGYNIMTFYYDNQKDVRGGMSVGPFASYSDRPSKWKDRDIAVKGVVFDPSFADYTDLTSTAYWFYNFRALQTITGLEYVKTSNVTDMAYMFSGCRSLTSLDVTTFDTRKVTDMAQMFYDCGKLTTLDVSNFKTDNVTNMVWMFNGCKGLTTLDVSSFNTEKVTNMKGMFEYCTGLSTLDLSNFNTANVTTMNDMFYICTGLKTVNVSSFNTENVTDMGGMFYNCPALTSLDLSSFNTEKVTNMNGMFDRSKLYVIYVGDKWTNAQVTEGDGMFSNCTNLVGGAWTAYDADHTDHTYAHIDGGVENPGYLTSIADTAAAAAVTFSRSMYELTLNCETPNVRIMYAVIPANGEGNNDSWMMYTQPITLTEDCKVTALALRPNGIQSAETSYEFRMSDIDTVETPRFSWNGDELTISCATEGASIYYTITDSSGGTTEEFLYQQPFDVTIDITISAVARKQGMNDSQKATLVYRYTDWQTLLSAIAYADSIVVAATGNSRVSEEMLTDLQAQINDALALYAARTAVEEVIMVTASDLRNAAAFIEDILNADKEAYAVLSENDTKLTFYYDYDKQSRGGMGVGPFTTGNLDDRGWNNAAGTITTVVFDESMAECRTLTSTRWWFTNFQMLRTINGLENLKTDNVTDMCAMFNGCSSLTKIDLSMLNTANVTTMQMLFDDCINLTSVNMKGLNTAKVTDTRAMFYNCSALKSLDLSDFNGASLTAMGGMFYGSSSLETIYVGSGWNIANIVTDQTSSTGVFANCTSLVGGAWTAFDTDHIEYDYAHIDGGVDNPGYLTSIADTIAPASVTFRRSMYELTLNCETPNVKIYYSIMLAGGVAVDDGRDQLYTQPITLWADCEVIAHAVRANGVSSAVSTYTFRMDDVNTVETPTFAWDNWYNHKLTIETATSEATVYYSMQPKDSVGNYLQDYYVEYTAPIEVSEDVLLKAIAKKEGMNVSDTLVLEYPYQSWTRLQDAIYKGLYVVSICEGSSKVNQNDVAYLKMNIQTCQDSLYLRTATRDVIEDLAAMLYYYAAQLEAQVTDVDFTYDTTTGSLTVSGGTTMDEALEAAGGRNTVAGHVTSIIWDKDTPLTDDMLEGFTNPNMLVYVKDASLAPSTVTNVIVDGVADFILLVDTDSLDNDFYCPQEFRTRTISYTRLFGQSTEIGVCRGWETIALPFEPLTISHEKNGLLRPFASAANDGKPFWLRQMSATGLVDAERIEANVPYIISMPNNPNYADEFNQAGRVTFSATDVVIPATDLGEVEGATVSLIPTFQRVAKAPEVYAINRYEAYGNNLEGSVFVSELRDVRPFEAYTRHHDQSPAPMFYPLSEWLEDGANGIDEIVLAMSRMAGQSETWYTLDGRKLNGQPKTKGVYIVKGKKVVVR